MRRRRNAKIIATLGPATSNATIRALFDLGADVFRLNFSHGSHDDHRANVGFIREVERDTGRPVGVLMDLQGPKLRLGEFEDGAAKLKTGQTFRLDLSGGLGTAMSVRFRYLACRIWELSRFGFGRHQLSC